MQRLKKLRKAEAKKCLWLDAKVKKPKEPLKTWKKRSEKKGNLVWSSGLDWR